MCKAQKAFSIMAKSSQTPEQETKNLLGSGIFYSNRAVNQFESRIVCFRIYQQMEPVAAQIQLKEIDAMWGTHKNILDKASKQFGIHKKFLVAECIDKHNAFAIYPNA